MEINTKKYRGFVFDGCHKFYLVEKTTTDKELADSYWDYNEIYNFDRLQGLWLSSCPLRFINTFTGLKTIIPQGSRIKTIKLK